MLNQNLDDGFKFDENKNLSKRKGFVSLEDLIRKRAEQSLALDSFSEKTGLNCEKEMPFLFKKILEEELNKKAAGAARVLYLKDKVLWVEAASSAWACQIRFMEVRILKKLNEAMGKEVAGRMGFRVGG